MSLSLTDVEKIAFLARLALTPEQKVRLQGELTAVLDYVALFDELEIADVPPTASAVRLENITRPDEVLPSMPLAEVLQNAAAHQADQFLIQTVLSE